MIDWAGEFQRKFGKNPMIATLKQQKFHGKLMINFCEGSPSTSHIEWCVKPYAGATTRAVGTTSSTLKGGDGGSS